MKNLILLSSSHYDTSTSTPSSLPPPQPPSSSQSPPQPQSPSPIIAVLNSPSTSTYVTSLAIDSTGVCVCRISSTDEFYTQDEPYRFNIEEDSDSDDEENEEDGDEAEEKVVDKDFFFATTLIPPSSLGNDNVVLLTFLSAARTGGIYISTLYLSTSSSNSNSSPSISISTITHTTELFGRVDDGLSAVEVSHSKEIIVMLTSEDKLMALTLPSSSLKPKPNPNTEENDANENVEDDDEDDGGSQIFEVPSPHPHLKTSPCLIKFNAASTHFLLSQVDLDLSSDSKSKPNNTNSSAVTRVRIFASLTGVLTSVLRNEDGTTVTSLSSRSLTWSPSSDIHDRTATCCGVIAAARRVKSNRITGVGEWEVVLFERNGLRHREFAFPSDLSSSSSSGGGRDDGGVGLMQFNQRGDILAVSSSTAVHLFSRSNYSWSLKYTFNSPPFLSPSPMDMNMNMITSLTFDPTSLYTLTYSSSTYYNTSTLLWDANVDDTNKSTIAVVDGKSLKLTPFCKCVVPPPYCAGSVGFEGGVLSVGFGYDDDTDAGAGGVKGLKLDGCVLMSNGSISFFGSTRDDDGVESEVVGNYKSPVVLGTIDGDVLKLKGGFLRQLVVLEVDILDEGTPTSSADGDERIVVSVLCISTSMNNVSNKEQVIDYTFSLTSSSSPSSTSTPSSSPCKVTVTLLSTKAVTAETSILRIAKGPTSQTALVETFDGELYVYEKGVTNPHLRSMNMPFYEPCPSITSLSDNHVIGMSNRSRLYCGEQVVCTSVTSYYVSKQHGFVCYITSDSRAQMKFQHISSLVEFDVYNGAEESINELGYEPRSVEAGSMILAIVPTKPLVIVQMPRGNLEGIAARALTLTVCRRLLDACSYGEVFDLMRRQRIDFNFIIDHNPRLFMDNLKGFLEQVRREDWLNLFVSCLQDVDFTLNKYMAPYPISEEERDEMLPVVVDFSSKSSFFANKVNIVCEALRLIMVAQNDDARLLNPILSTYAKQNPPSLESALLLITDKCAALQTPLTSKYAQDSFMYLAFLSSYPLLFNSALGLYNFSLAKAVARNSQMDPKVYLTLVNWYEGLEEFRGKYEVDLRLERYEKALVNVAKCGDWKEAVRLIEVYKLHKVGLGIYSGDGGDKETRELIICSLARRLVAEGNAQAAVNLYMAVGKVNDAIRAARVCGDWRGVFNAFDEVDGDGDDDDGGEEEELSLFGNGGGKNTLESLTEAVVEALSTSTSAMSRTDKFNAARVLLDYAQDTEGAVRVLIEGQWWCEALRIAKLYKGVGVVGVGEKRGRLIRSVRDACVSFGKSAVIDIEERKEKFSETILRHDIVVQIRADVKLKEEEHIEEYGVPLNDGTASNFSQGTDFSNASMRSASSTTSTNSTKSYNSGYSGTSTNFSLKKRNDHRGYSGGDSKQAKKLANHKKRNKVKDDKRMKPGSVEELAYLRGSLVELSVGGGECEVISETIVFLSRIGELDGIGNTLYGAFEEFREVMNLGKVEGVEGGVVLGVDVRVVYEYL